MSPAGYMAVAIGKHSIQSELFVSPSNVGNRFRHGHCTPVDNLPGVAHHFEEFGALWAAAQQRKRIGPERMFSAKPYIE